MAGTDPHPSDVPCLVETSTAHDGFLFLVSSSCTGDLKLLGSLSKALSPDSNPQSSFLPPPEMFEPLNQTSAQPDRRANSPLPSTAKLGFQLLGPFLLGPLRFLSPLTKDVAFDLLLLSSRFERNSYLSYSSQYVCRLMEPFVRRLHLENNPVVRLVRDRYRKPVFRSNH